MPRFSIFVDNRNAKIDDKPAIIHDENDDITDFNPNKFAFLKDTILLTLDMLRETDKALYRLESCDILQYVGLKAKCYGYVKGVHNEDGSVTVTGTVTKAKGYYQRS